MPKTGRHSGAVRCRGLAFFSLAAQVNDVDDDK